MIYVDASGGGYATHLGRFTVSYEVEVTLPAVGVGTAIFTAANGDLLFTEFTGQSEPTADPDVSFIEDTDDHGRDELPADFFDRRAASGGSRLGHDTSDS